MEAVESKSQSLRQNSQTMSEISLRLEENLKGFQSCVKETLALIEKDEDLSEMTADFYDFKMDELKELVTELSRKHGELADIHLNAEVSRNTEKITTPFKTQHADSSTSSSPQVTQTLTPNTDKFMTPVGFDVTFSSSGGGFHLSRRECVESSSDSGHKHLNSPVKETKVDDPDVLLKKISVLEEDLLSLQEKLQNLSEENSNLKGNLHEKESDLLSEKANLEDEKTKVVELQKQVSDLKLEISECNRKLETTGKVLEGSRKQASMAHDEVVRLSSQLVEQNGYLRKYESTLDNFVTLCEQSETQQEAFRLLEEEVALKVSVRDNEIKKLNTKINRLKTELTEKGSLVKDLNQKRNSLMSEKDVVKAKLDKIRAEMCSRDNKIQELETLLGSLQADHERVLLSFDGEKKVTNELKVKVGEFEKEVDRQREVMSDRAEEKREAIRQLSSSVEHYRSEYKQLREAFVKQCAVSSSRFYIPYISDAIFLKKIGDLNRESQRLV